MTEQNITREQLRARLVAIGERISVLKDNYKDAYSTMKAHLSEYEVAKMCVDELEAQLESLRSEKSDIEDQIDLLNEETGEGFPTIPVERIEGGAR